MENQMYDEKTKHIDVKYFVHDIVDKCDNPCGEDWYCRQFSRYIDQTYSYCSVQILLELDWCVSYLMPFGVWWRWKKIVINFYEEFFEKFKISWRFIICHEFMIRIQFVIQLDLWGTDKFWVNFCRGLWWSEGLAPFLKYNFLSYVPIYICLWPQI